VYDEIVKTVFLQSQFPVCTGQSPTDPRFKVYSTGEPREDRILYVVTRDSAMSRGLRHELEHVTLRDGRTHSPGRFGA
jgi:hypothetical protein